MDDTQAMILKSLCDRAIGADITLDEFFSQCPDGERLNSVLLREVIEDLEDGITHMPGRLFRGGIDHTAWLKSDLRWKLMVDRCALDRYGAVAEEDVLSARSAALGAFGAASEQEIVRILTDDVPQRHRGDCPINCVQDQNPPHALFDRRPRRLLIRHVGLPV